MLLNLINRLLKIPYKGYTAVVTKQTNFYLLKAKSDKRPIIYFSLREKTLITLLLDYLKEVNY